MISATLIPIQMKINPLFVKVIHKENGGVLRAILRVHLGYSVSKL